MTKDEIKKALTCCSNPSISYCKDCPYANYGEFDCCNGKMCKDALNLITEQDKENEKLEQLNAIQCDAWQKLSDENERLVTENNSNLRYNSVLRKENKKLKEEIKQAQLGVLGKLWSNISNSKQLIQSHIADGSFTIEDIYMEIDELMAEVENDNDEKVKRIFNEAGLTVEKREQPLTDEELDKQVKEIMSCFEEAQNENCGNK